MDSQSNVAGCYDFEDYTLVTLSDDNLPALFNAADGASVNAQRRYMVLVCFDLILLVLGATLSAMSLTSTSGKSILAVLGGTLFVISLIVTGVIRLARYERDWYGGRAIAESVKTLAWRYMMRAEPYASHLKVDEADRKFASDLSSVFSERKYLSGAIGGRLSTNPQITDRMRETRNLGTKARKSIYVSQRINGQRQWYSGKAKSSRNREELWFVAIVISQILAVISAFWLVRSTEFPINLTGIFSTLATAFLAWLQVKKHQELAQSFGLAAQELGLILEEARHITSDDDLSRFVSDSESAISREHTLWVARRDTA